jgi:catechol 2,3-dioxygenase
MRTTDVKHPTLHHVNLKTKRLGEMIEWYGLVVGLEVTHEFPDGAWLSNDGANHRLALLAGTTWKDDPEKLEHTGLHHTAFEYESMDDLLDTYVRLKGHSVMPHACLDHGMTMSFYYVDPDGNSVELQCDEFGDWAESKAFMHSSAQFAENPIGVTVDPDRLIEARADGADAAVLHARAYAGDFVPDAPLDLRIPRV